jgi:small nuclear ribonucleoprotein (snRNP)-like protein
VRWERLFDDLEAQLDAASAAELAGEVSERTRYERGQLTLADRLLAWVGQPVRLQLLGGTTVAGRLEQAAQEWVVVEHGPSVMLVPLAALVDIVGLGAAASTGDRQSVPRRMGLTAALRAVARDRSPVHVELIDGRAVAGTVDAVGADHLDLAEHPPDEPRRPAAVRRVHTVPLTAIAAVRPTAGSSTLAV